MTEVARNVCLCDRSTYLSLALGPDTARILSDWAGPSAELRRAVEIARPTLQRSSECKRSCSRVQIGALTYLSPRHCIGPI